VDNQNLIEKRKKYRQYNKEKKAGYDRKYREKNKEAISIRGKIWKQKNKDRLSEYNREYQKKNPEIIIKNKKIYYEKSKETILASCKKYRQENKEIIAERKKDRDHKNKEAIREYSKKYYIENKEKRREYIKNNREKMNERNANRRAAEIHRTPAWADRDAIKTIYKEANRLTKETGIKHHVDHIIPLRGKLVSGLHVENNLQILTKEDNEQKHNTIDLDTLNNVNEEHAR